MIAAPTTLLDLPLPESARQLMKSGNWPGLLRIGTTKFASTQSGLLLKDFDVTLQESIEKMEAETLGLREMPSHDKNSCYWGSKEDRKRDLPWLDLDQALCIGGGADWGDDTWLMLDYRENTQEPRVVVNQYLRAEDYDDYAMAWHEVAPSFSALVKVLQTRDGKWEPGRYCDGEKRAAYFGNLTDREKIALRRTNWLGKGYFSE